MWGQLLLAGVALVGVLVTTNVLAGGQTRARHRLRDELELVDKMPDELTGRAVFEEYVSESLQVYVDRERQRRLTLRQLLFRRALSRIVHVVAAVIALGSTMWAMQRTEPGPAFTLWRDGLFWLAIAGLLVQGFMVTWTVRLSNQISLRYIQLAREHSSGSV